MSVRESQRKLSNGESKQRGFAKSRDTAAATAHRVPRLPSLQTAPQIKNGVPCLVPRDGKILDEEDASKPYNNTSAVNEEHQGRSS